MNHDAKRSDSWSVFISRETNQHVLTALKHSTKKRLRVTSLLRRNRRVRRVCSHTLVMRRALICPVSATLTESEVECSAKREYYSRKAKVFETQGLWPLDVCDPEEPESGLRFLFGRCFLRFRISS